MKLTFTFNVNETLKLIVPALIMLMTITVSAQTYPVTLGGPGLYVYSLTSNGEIDEVSMSTGVVHQVLKNTTYSGNPANQANGLSYNPVNGKFYYFKRNIGTSPQEFVSFNPSTGTVSILASSTCAATTHTGCVNATGTGYYTIDINGNLNYYDIAANTWKKITGNFVDQDGNNVTTVIQNQNSGDIAMDGLGNIWLVTSSNTNYGLYKIPAPIPTTSTAQIVVERDMDPTTATPGGYSFQGIAFDVNGDILLAASNDKLYRQQTVSGSSLFYVANFSKSGLSNDMTSQNFPTGVLAVNWINFSATLQSNTTVALNWQVIEENNYGFYVEKSLDGNTWETVAFIPGNNISESVQNYFYDYSNKLSGKVYFRIKQVDNDGAYTYSPAKMVSIGGNKQNVSIWPNPASDYINVSIQETKYNSNSFTVQLFDLSGKMVTKQQLQPGVSAINVSDLSRGIYIAKVQSVNDISYTQKIVKQ